MLKFKLIHINKRAIEIHFGFAKLKLKLEYGLSIMFCSFRGSNYISSFWIKYWFKSSLLTHYGDVTMTAIASQITSLTIVYSTVYSDADQRKHQSSPSLAFVLGIHRGPVNSPHKWPVTRKIFPFDGVIMQRDRWRLGLVEVNNTRIIFYSGVGPYRKCSCHKFYHLLLFVGYNKERNEIDHLNAAVFKSV